MSIVRFQLASSVDGFVAGPDQSVENPLGVGGLALHEWVFELEAWRKQHGEQGGEVNASNAVVRVAIAPVLLGAGERLFGNLAPPQVEQVRAIAAPNVTHIKYRVVR